MLRAFNRTIGIDYSYGRIIIFTNGSGALLRETKLGENGAKVLGNLARGDGNKEFSLSRTGGGNRLCLGAVCNNSAGKEKGVFGGRAAFREVIGMGCVNIAIELQV